MLMMQCVRTGQQKANIDAFGIVQLYPDSLIRSDSWFMNMANPNINRNRFDVREDGTITLNGDGSWNIPDTQIRMNLYNRNGYTASNPGQDIPTYDRVVMANQGYMQDSDDWKNCEITMFVKLVAFSGSVYFSPFVRSGWHTSGTAPNGQPHGCEGTGVKPRIYNDGDVLTVKETWHNTGYVTTNGNNVTTSLQNRWIGIKTAVYDAPTGVKQELWINESGDPGLLENWEKVVDHIDTGGWGTVGDDLGCLNASPDQRMLWGGPIITFRWDNATNVDFKWLSAREIKVPS